MDTDQHEKIVVVTGEGPSHEVIGYSQIGAVIQVRSGFVREAIEEILLVWKATEAEEWVNRAGYIPFR
jgi:hypothetical protein